MRLFFCALVLAFLASCTDLESVPTAAVHPADEGGWSLEAKGGGTDPNPRSIFHWMPTSSEASSGYSTDRAATTLVGDGYYTTYVDGVDGVTSQIYIDKKTHDESGDAVLYPGTQSKRTPRYLHLLYGGSRASDQTWVATVFALHWVGNSLDAPYTTYRQRRGMLDVNMGGGVRSSFTCERVVYGARSLHVGSTKSENHYYGDYQSAPVRKELVGADPVTRKRHWRIWTPDSYFGDEPELTDTRDGDGDGTPDQLTWSGGSHQALCVGGTLGSSVETGVLVHMPLDIYVYEK